MRIERLVVCATLATALGCGGAATPTPAARPAASVASPTRGARTVARTPAVAVADRKRDTKAKKAGDPGLVGRPAPGFSVPAAANARGALELEDLLGKVVLVEFWATTCEPCKESLPRLQALYARYRASGLKIVAISEDARDQKGKIPAFVVESGARFMFGWDEDRSAASAYRAETPSSFLVDRAGVVRFAHVGAQEGDEGELEREVRQLLDP